MTCFGIEIGFVRRNRRRLRRLRWNLRRRSIAATARRSLDPSRSSAPASPATTTRPPRTPRSRAARRRARVRRCAAQASARRQAARTATTRARRDRTSTATMTCPRATSFAAAQLSGQCTTTDVAIVAASRIAATPQTMSSRCMTRTSTQAANSVSSASVSTVVTPYGTTVHGRPTSVIAIAIATASRRRQQR